MSTLAVIAYPDQSTAGEAAAALQRMQKELLIQLEDVAWVTKSQDDKLKLHQGTSLTSAGAAGGALWGFLFGLLFLVPIAGMAVGAATGALAGHLADYGIDDKWIKDVASAIPPGGSALFVMARGTNRSGCCPRWPSSAVPSSAPTSPPSSSRRWKRRCPRPRPERAAAAGAGISGSRTRRRAPAPNADHPDLPAGDQ